MSDARNAQPSARSRLAAVRRAAAGIASSLALVSGVLAAAPTTGPTTSPTTAPALMPTAVPATLPAAVVIAAPVASVAVPVAPTPAAPVPPVAAPVPTAPVPVAPMQQVEALATVAKPRILIVSIDGARPDCLLRADMPTVRGLMDRGTFTLWANTTDMAVTTPSHISMLSGVTPERHGIFFNGDPPDDARILVPTLFDIAKQAGLSTGMAAGKSKFSLFQFTGNIDHVDVTKNSVGDDAQVGWAAQRIVRAHRPRVMVVHFPGPDTAGHAIGWGTPEQLDALEGADRALAGVLRAYEEAGLLDSTYVIVSADHGGVARVHGKDDFRSRYIPWVLAGPGVRANYDLTRLGKAYDVSTYDTFATACAILGLPTATDLDGKPVLPAFEDFDLMSAPAPTAGPTTAPVNVSAMK